MRKEKTTITSGHDVVDKKNKSPEENKELLQRENATKENPSQERKYEKLLANGMKCSSRTITPPLLNMIMLWPQRKSRCKLLGRHDERESKVKKEPVRCGLW
jgi:hypothetical protein